MTLAFLRRNQAVAEVRAPQADQRRDHAGEDVPPAQAHASEVLAMEQQLAEEELERHSRHAGDARRDAPGNLLGGEHGETVLLQAGARIRCLTLLGGSTSEVTEVGIEV
jgi:hypothetical protein